MTMIQVVEGLAALQFPPGPPPGEAILIALVTIATLIGALYILGPIARAFARRIEGRGMDPGLQDELHLLRERVADVDVLRERVMELEERVDFTERLLARGSGPDQLPAAQGRPDAPRVPGTGG